MKRLLWFALGVIAGAVATKIYCDRHCKKTCPFCQKENEELVVVKHEDIEDTEEKPDTDVTDILPRFTAEPKEDEDSVNERVEYDKLSAMYSGEEVEARNGIPTVVEHEEKAPFVIPEDMVGGDYDEHGAYETERWTAWADGIVTNEEDDVIDIETIDEMGMSELIEPVLFKDEPIVRIRNPRYLTDYIVTKDTHAWTAVNG